MINLFVSIMSSSLNAKPTDDIFKRNAEKAIRNFTNQVLPSFVGNDDILEEFTFERLDKYINDYLELMDYSKKVVYINRDQYLPFLRFLELSVINHFENYVTYQNEFKKKTVWEDHGDGKVVTNLALLLLLNQLTCSLYGTLQLFINGLELQSKILFRSYMEAAGILTACLLDVDFFKLYLDSPAETEEYKKLWFKVLKPAKVKDKIRNVLNEIDATDTDRKAYLIKTGILSPAFEKILNDLSDIAHSRLQSLIKHHSYPHIKGFKVSLSDNWSINRNQTLLLFIESSCHVSHIIEVLMESHIPDLSNVKENKIRSFCNDVSIMGYVYATYDGLYDFSKVLVSE